MGTFKRLRLNNTHIVDLIDPHFTGCMDDLICVQQDANVCDPTFLIVKKCQVACLRFFQEPYSLSLSRLLPGVPEQCDTQEFENALRKPAAIDPENTLSTPEIWRI